MSRALLALAIAMTATVPLPALQPPRIYSVSTGEPPIDLGVDLTRGTIYVLGQQGLVTAGDETARRKSEFTITPNALYLAIDSISSLVYVSGGNLPLEGEFGGRVTALDPASGEAIIGGVWLPG